jgi:hypothetical protein
MAILQVVTPTNLGTTIKAAAITAGKYDLNVDLTRLTVSGLGVVSTVVDPAAVTALNTLTGIASLGTDLGTFPLGTIIPDSSTIKAALVALDTYVSTLTLGSTVQEEGVTLGTASTVTTLNFVGTGTTATRVGNVVTVTTTGGATNLTLSVPTATTIDVLSDTGTDVTLPAGTITAAGLMAANDKLAINAIGITAGQADLDTFTGTTIPDDSTVKAALQALETSLELKQSGVQYSDEGIALGTSGTVTAINYVGSGVTATRVGNVITTTIAGADLTLANPTATTLDVLSSAGTDVTLPAGTTTLAGLMTANDKLAINAIGVTAGQADLDIFTGITIPDDSTVKAALQALETSLELKQIGIQYSEEGVALGTIGTVANVNYVGPITTATRVGNVVTVTSVGTNLTLSVPTATTLDVLSDTGTDVTLPAGTTTAAGLMTANDKLAINSLGVVAGQADLDTFTGVTIPDNSTVKQALQSLETQLELLKINGLFLGSAATFAALPVLNFAGGAAVNGDWAVLTAQDGIRLKGIYVYTGALFTFVVEIPSAFATAALAVPLAPTNAVGAVGVATLYAREDHKHPEAGVSVDANNLMTIGSDGLHEVTRDPSALNYLTTSAAGLLVSETTLKADFVFDTDVTDAFGVHLFWGNLLPNFS